MKFAMDEVLKRAQDVLKQLGEKDKNKLKMEIYKIITLQESHIREEST